MRTLIPSISITIIFLATLTGIETTFAYHNKYHLNSTGYDITISPNDNIPEWLFEGIKSGIIKNMIAEGKGNSFSNNNNTLQQIQIEITKYGEGTNKDNNTTKANLILTSHKYVENDKSNYDDIVGQVKNIGNELAESVKVIFTFYNNNGDIVGTDFTFLETDNLNPGQQAPFSGSVDKREIKGAVNYEIALAWYNSDGLEEYIEDVSVTKDTQEKKPIIENIKEKTENENNPFFNVDNNDIEKIDNDDDNNDNKDDDENKDNDDENEDDNENDKDDNDGEDDKDEE